MPDRWFQITPEETQPALLDAPGFEWSSDDEPFHQEGIVHKIGTRGDGPVVEALHVLAMDGTNNVLGHARVAFVPPVTSMSEFVSLVGSVPYGKRFARLVEINGQDAWERVGGYGSLVIDFVSIASHVRGHGVGLLFLDRIFRTWSEASLFIFGVLPAQFTMEPKPDASEIDISVAQEAQSRLLHHFLANYEDPKMVISPIDGAVWLYIDSPYTRRSYDD